MLLTFFMALAERQRLDFQPLHLPDGCTWGTLGLSRERFVSSPIVEFLPLPRYAYSLKPICSAKLVTAYLVLKGHAEFQVKNLPFSGRPQNEYCFPKTLQTVRRHTYKAP